MQNYIYAVIFSLCLNCALGDNVELDKRTKRQAPPTPTVPAIIVRDPTNNLVMVLTSVNVTVRQIEARDEFKETSYLTATSKVSENGTDKEIVLTFPPPAATAGLKITTFDLTLKFSRSDSYWAMTDATVNLVGTETDKAFNFANTQLLSDIGIAVPIDLSFHCSRFGSLYPSKHVGNHTFSIDLRGFQVQPYSTQPRFGESYECVGFFTIGILSGIFVTLILMAIIAWGLAMIMNVKTMDRFDDPKGKPISFGGNE